MIRCLLAIGLAWCCLGATAQRFYHKKYFAEANGLPTDIIKSTTQDSLGYFWIATDEGLVKYDGIRFTSYRYALQSNYVKGFLTTRSGRLLVFGDLDLLEINNQGDTVFFKSVCPVQHVLTDSSLLYPKLLFEDQAGTLWVSESQAVVKLNHDGSFTRYPFDMANRTPQFLRAFSIFEDTRGNLFVSSFQGNVFRYNRARDKFEPYAVSLPADVEFASILAGKLTMGCATGLYQADLLPQGGFAKPVQIKAIPYVSYIAQVNAQEYFVATRNHEHFIADLRKGTFTDLNISIDNVNHVYVSEENDIWLAGNDGWVFLRENIFYRINPDMKRYLECITEDTLTGDIYYADNEHMYRYDASTHKSTLALHTPAGYFQSLVATPEGIWVANAFQVLLWHDGHAEKILDFSDKRRFVTALSKDAAGNIWIAAPGLRQAFMLDASHTLHAYNVPLGDHGVINTIVSGDDGVYIPSTGKDSYLYYMPPGDTVFQNISLPANVPLPDHFKVTHLVKQGKYLWLATSEGLFRYDHKTLTRVELGKEYTALPVRAIQTYRKDGLLVANAFGMLLFDMHTGLSDLFNESYGLPSRTIPPDGILIAHQQHVWVGTSRGLCYTDRPLRKDRKTIYPKFTRVLVNGKKLPTGADQRIAHGSFVSVTVSSITFPENEVTFQYRLQPDALWKTFSGKEINFSDLDPNHHTLAVRARKNGPYTWSDPSYLTFTVTAPFWQKTWFYLACFLGMTGLIAATVAVVDVNNRQRHRKLQRLVDGKTMELRQRNDELIALNLEKNNLIGIVSHDLKNPLNEIIAFLGLIKMDGQTDRVASNYLNMLEQITHRIIKMIDKILDVDAIESKRLNLRMQPINLPDLLHAVSNRFEAVAAKKDITLLREIDENIFIEADRAYLEQVVDNLLSNAIKFSPYHATVRVRLHQVEDRALFEFRDEGPGLSVGDKKKLFGKFQKLSARPTGAESSTGLGLSIVKKLVLVMGGEVWVKSKEGAGASFFVAFKIVP